MICSLPFLPQNPDVFLQWLRSQVQKTLALNQNKTCIAGVLAFISLTFAGCLFLSCSSDFEELGAHLESWRLVILAMPLGLPWHPSVQTKVLLAGSIQGYVRGITFPSWAVNIEFSLGDLKWPSHPWTEIFLWEIGFHFQPPHFTAYHISHTSS